MHKKASVMAVLIGILTYYSVNFQDIAKMLTKP